MYSNQEKDLEKLEAEAKANKPDYINIGIFDDNQNHIGLGERPISSNINLHENLLIQILRIARLHREKIDAENEKKYQKEIKSLIAENNKLKREKYSNLDTIKEYEKELDRISNKFNWMTVREFRKYKRNYGKV